MDGARDPVTRGGANATIDGMGINDHPPPNRLQPHDLRGKNLRYTLLTLLWRHGPASIAELRARIESSGLIIGGADPNKTIGDVLRYEASIGRVRRVRRGVYAALPRPDTTTRRHRDRMRLLNLEGAARTRPAEAA